MFFIILSCLLIIGLISFVLFLIISIKKQLFIKNLFIFSITASLVGCIFLPYGIDELSVYMDNNTSKIRSKNIETFELESNDANEAIDIIFKKIKENCNDKALYTELRSYCLYLDLNGNLLYKSYGDRNPSFPFKAMYFENDECFIYNSEFKENTISINLSQNINYSSLDEKYYFPFTAARNVYDLVDYENFARKSNEFFTDYKNKIQYEVVSDVKSDITENSIVIENEKSISDMYLEISFYCVLTNNSRHFRHSDSLNFCIKI